MNGSEPYTLITGASSGLGEATALMLADSRNLVLHGRNKDRLENVGKNCERKGAHVILFPFDLEQPVEAGRMLTTLITAEKLRVDSFLHFAGMTDVLPINRTKYSVGLKVMNVNYFAATEIVSLLLRKKVNGDALRRIILISSIVVNGGKKYQPHYCASKGAVEALGMALATELAPAVRVNVISPGSFKTRIVQSGLTDWDEQVWHPDTLLPPGDVDEVAKVVRFILSDDAAYLTGQIINVDGGERFPHI